jgi:uncharacterized protein (TIGR02246 family)
MHAYEVATNAHDIGAVLELIAEDAVYLFSNQSSHIGKAEIREAIQANFDAIEDETYRIQNLKWLANSMDVAACVYQFSWSGRIKGKPASGQGRGTTVIRRVDGRWKVVLEHLSAGGLD